MIKKEFNVLKMVCESCEQRVVNVLKMIDGIENVEASYKNNKVVVYQSREVDDQLIIDAILDLGFEIKED